MPRTGSFGRQVRNRQEGSVRPAQATKQHATVAPTGVGFGTVGGPPRVHIFTYGNPPLSRLNLRRSKIPHLCSPLRQDYLFCCPDHTKPLPIYLGDKQGCPMPHDVIVLGTATGVH